MRGLPSSCYPEAKPANAFASMKAKEQKAKVKEVEKAEWEAKYEENKIEEY